MTKISKVLVGASLATLGSLTTNAHATQPLQAFIDRAATQSFDAREVAATSLQREAEADSSLGKLLPVFSARGVYTRNQYEVALSVPTGDNSSTRVTIQRHDQLDGYLQLDVPIVDVSTYQRYKSQRAVADAARIQGEATRVDVTRAVAQSYFSFIGASALARSAEQNLKAAELNLKTVEDRRAAGAATDLDRERAIANVEQAHQNIASAQLTADLAARRLETLSGLAPTPSEVFPDDDLHEEPALERWLALTDSTPQARVARSSEEAARRAQKSAQAALYPTLAASAQEHFTNATGFSGRSAFYTLQLVAQFRLDYSTFAAARAQESAALVQQVRSQRTSRNLSDATFEAYRTVQTAITRSKAARSQAAAASRASELATERYNAGVATQLDVTQAQRDAFTADANRISADADLAFSRAALRLSVAQSPTSPRNP